MTPIPREKKNNAINLILSGLSTRKIADRLKISRGSISNFRRELSEELSEVKNGRPAKLQTRTSGPVFILLILGKPKLPRLSLKFLSEIITLRLVDRRSGDPSTRWACSPLRRKKNLHYREKTYKRDLTLPNATNTGP